MLALFWRARLDTAKDAYDLAVVEARKGAPGSDGMVQAARARYAEILKVFTDLVISGETPSAPTPS